MNELELILTDILGCSRSQLYLNSSSTIFKDKDIKRLDEILIRRSKSYPLQYILGYVEFMGLKLEVNKNVLIPRPETEVLVETVIRRLELGRKRIVHSRILDIGTGSGNIAISLAKILNGIEVTATDISDLALKLARENSRKHDTQERIRFLKSDLFNNRFFRKNKIKFDVIVSNPPYIPSSEVGVFDVTTKKEPRAALDGGKDGLDFYRRLSKEFSHFLSRHGDMVLEIGFGQSPYIKEIFKGFSVEFQKDYQDIDRVCIISRRDNG